MNLQGYHTATIYNPANGQGAQLNLVGEESEMQLQEPFENDKTGRGEFIYAGDNSFINFVAYDMDSEVQDKLKQFMNTGTRCHVAIIGVNEVVLWEEPAKTKFSKPKGFTTGRRQRIIERIAKEGGEHKIYSGVNILRVRNGWGDLGSSLPGWSFDGSLTQPFGNDENSIQLNNSEELSSELIIPVSGVKATFSFNRGGTHIGVNAEIRIQASSFNDTLLDSFATLVPAGNNDPILATEMVLPPLTYKVKVSVRPSNGSGQIEDFSIKSPRLRFDGKVEDIRS